MTRKIKAYSIWDAFEYLKEDLKEDNYKNIPEEFINLDELSGLVSMDFLDAIDGKGIFFGRTVERFGENANQIQTIVNNFSVKGDKKWKTTYLGVWADSRMDVIPGSQSDIKKECVDKVREIVSETGRNAHVIIGKSTVEFSRIQSEINYKPSPKQEMGTYEFYC